MLLSGEAKPEVANELLQTLAPFNISILDLEQISVRGRVLLAALIDLDPAHAEGIQIDLDEMAKRIDMDLAIDFQEAVAQVETHQLTHCFTILAPELKPAAISEITELVFSFGGTIAAISRIAHEPVTAIEFKVSLPPNADFRERFSRIISEHRIDSSFIPLSLHSEGKRIVMLDMDSTLIQQEVIDLLARKAGVGEEVAGITESAMRGELDFAASLAARVSKLAGLAESAIAEVAGEIELSTGARELIQALHSLGHKVGVVSGGFLNVIEPLLKELKIDFYRANSLEVADGFLTGKTTGAVIDREAKANLLLEFAQSEAVELSKTVAVGDGANDLGMIAISGLGIAFSAKPAVQAAADCAINSPSLERVLFLMGILQN